MKKRIQSRNAISVLNKAQDNLVARMSGVSRKKIMARRQRPCPPEAVVLAFYVMPLAIAAADKANILRKRRFLSDDAEQIVRRLVGHVGIFLGLGRFKSTFTTMTVYGDEDRILASKQSNIKSRKATQRLLQELLEDLKYLEGAGKEIEKIILKEGSNYLLESPYLSIAAYIRGLAQSARREIRQVAPLLATRTTGGTVDM